MFKKKSFVGALLLASSLVIGSVSAFGANPYGEGVSGTQTTFTKYLIVPNGTKVPNSTFNFTVAAGTAKPATTTTMEVLAGVGTPTIAAINFTQADSLTPSTGVANTNIDVQRALNSRGTGLTDATGVHLDAGESFALKTVTVNFSSVKFPEPGIYRYIVTETANADHAAMGLIHDNDTDRVLDVYVTDNNGTLEVAGYILHMNESDIPLNATSGAGDVETPGTALTDKTDGFTNEYKPYDLDFKKEVDGNHASRDKYFEFTVTCTNVNDSDQFTVSIADDNDSTTNDGSADNASGAAKPGGTSADKANKQNKTMVTGAELKAGQKFYLQHSQHIVIRGLPANATYNVVEDKENYKQEPASVTGYTDAVEGTIGTVAGDDYIVKTSYKNIRITNTPTGVVMTLIPGIAIIVLGLIAYWLSSKKKVVKK